MVEVENTSTEVRKGRGGGILGEAIWNYIMCALVLKFDVVSLVEPPDVVVLDENVAGFTSDGGSFSELDGGFVVFKDNSG